VSILDDPSPGQVEQIIEALLASGYASFPIRITGTPVPKDHRELALTPLWLDANGGFRLWASTLHLRTLDGFRATLVLARELLDAEARAHLRIAFDHMLAFAWVTADPTDLSRPMRIARYGFGFAEKQMQEMLPHDPDPMRHVDELALILEAKDKVQPPPNTRDLCVEVDAAWIPRLPAMAEGSKACFSYWYSHLFRGASAFVHPTSRGLDPVYVADGDAFVVRPAPDVPARVLEAVAMLTSVQIGIASLAAPWLVDASQLQRLGPVPEH
jgi:hypothetical protein